MKIAFASALLAAIASAATTNHAAVLVAGSNGYWNYRHQADIAHAYHILIANGVSPDNIVTMMFDDIATNPSNPFPGQIFNHPDGEDVYSGVKIDYRGADVTPEKFIAVMTGDIATAGGKVLTTDKNTKLFVNFSDHGAAGLIAFPSSYLYADQLQQTINTMEKKEMFGEMVFYLEACESGSMFPKLTKDQNVYAVTASDATQSSWAQYCSPDDVVNGVSLGTCLGDEFSVNWMEDTEGANPYSETLDEQFTTVKSKTQGSPVNKFGDFGFVNEPIANFEGSGTTSSSFMEYSFDYIKNIKSTQFIRDESISSKNRVDSRDVMMHYLYTRAQANGGSDAHQELIDQIQHRMNEDAVFLNVFPHHQNMANDLFVQPIDFDCLRFLVTVHDENCGRFSDYSLKYVKHLAHACETETPEMVQNYGYLIADTCRNTIA